MHLAIRRSVLVLVPMLDAACLIGTSKLGDVESGSSSTTDDIPTSTGTAMSTTLSTTLDPSATTGAPDDTDGSSTTDASTSTDATSSTSEEGESTTSDAPTLGEGCSVWEQDCAPGLKCNPYVSNGGGWDAARCVDIEDAPSQIGDLCTAEDGGSTGNDSCDLGLMCFFVDIETDLGECIALCTDELEPTCPRSTACAVFNAGALPLCLESCDPIAPDCPEGETCYAEDSAFVCMPTFDGNGDYLDDCTQIAQCSPGFICLDQSAVAGCEHDGCCTPFCDTDTPETCPEGSTGCTPFYAKGMAPEGYEDVGVCG